MLDIYGDSKASVPSAGQLNGKSAKKTRNVLQLSLCDAIPAHGPIADMAFSLAYNGVCSFIFISLALWVTHLAV